MLNIMNPPADWSTMKKLIWLRGEPIWSGGGEEMTASGATPLTITNALHKPMLKCETNILPVQDLHGYDAPWPAGGGKNKLGLSNIGRTAYGIKWEDKNTYYSISGACNESFSSTYIIGSSGNTINLEIPANTQCVISLAFSGTPSSWNVQQIINGAYAQIDIDGTESNYTAGVPFTLENAGTLKYIRTSVSLAFSQNSTYDIKAYVQLEYASSATSFAPYSNICPIVGWDGAEVTVSGKNLWNVNAFVRRDGYYKDDNGEEHPTTSGGGYTLNIINLKPSTQYTIQGTTGNMRLYYLSQNGSMIQRTEVVSTLPYTFTTPSTCHGIQLYYSVASLAPDTIQVEEGSTATTYEPYTASTSSVTFDSTVYGGSYEFVGGEGSVTMASVDLGTLVWSKTVGDPKFYAETSRFDGISDPYGEHLMCTCYAGGDAYAGVRNAISTRVGTYKRIWVCDETKTDLTGTQVASALAGQKLYYQLATPTPFTADGADIKTFKGTNHVWSDCGNTMEVKYIGKPTE